MAGQTICDEIYNYYLEVPIIPIDKGSQEEEIYKKVVDYVFKRTLEEYSKYFLLFKDKIFNPGQKTEIDIYKDIDENIIPKTLVVMGFNDLIYSPVILKYLEQSIVNTIRYGNIKPYSILEYVVNKDLPFFVEDLIKVSKKPILFQGRYIKLEPYKDYYFLYGVIRRYNPETGQCDLTPDDVDRFNKLFEYNLMLEIYSNRLFYDVLGIKSTSVSGLSTNFNYPQNTIMINQIRREKQQMLNKWASALSFIKGVDWL
jgi:hypothetical protein